MMDHLSDRCRSNKPINPVQPVRVPGDEAALTSLCAWAEKLGVDVPVNDKLL